MDLKKPKEILRNPIFIGVAGVIIGLVLGLVIGWWLWPVQWTDASAQNLRPDLQRDLLRMTILTFDQTNDESQALKIWNELGDQAELTLSEISVDPDMLSSEQVLKFSQSIAQAETTDNIPSVNQGTDVETGLGKNILWFGLICFVLLIAAGSLVYYFVLRNRTSVKREPLSSAMPSADFLADAPSKTPGMTIPGEQNPVAQFMTTYMFGDDLYDDSFSIDSPSGEFLGECGVGISDTIGVGEPKKISAFEVWLFDKNDIQTVTKVFMSAHSFDNADVRQRLESKGEPILAEPGKQILLETDTLQLEARVVDMSYGESPLPESSYFQRFTLELAIWPKEVPSIE